MAMSGFSITQLLSIASAGGGITIDASSFSVTQIISLANASGKNNARLVVAEASRLSITQLISIAKAGNGCVSFE